MLQKDRVRFYLKKPGKGRARFSVLQDTIKPDGKRLQKLVNDERIDAINAAYKSKLKPASVCEIELQEVIKQLYRPFQEAAPQFTEENLRLFQHYWDIEYSHRNLVDLDSARNDLLRAIESVGTLSLVSATRDQLQRQIDKKFKGNKQRRLVSRLNQLLKFAGRPIRLRRDKKDRKRVKYLSPDEFGRLLDFIEDKIEKLVLIVCFSTGCRIGEAFALTLQDIRDGVVHIDKQMTRNLAITDRKRGGECFCVPHPLGKKALIDWVKFPNKADYRNREWPKLVRRACKAAFKDKPEKWISTHGLRHSYAIWLLSKGISLSLVAQSLGDSITVAEEHYSGFVLTPDSIDAIKAKLKAN